MNKTIKILIILACITIILVMFNNVVYGAMEKPDTTYGADFNPDDPLYKPSTDSASDVGHLQTIGNAVVGFVQTIGSIASVGVLIVLGIKYMAGSVEEKAEYKKNMMPYVIGAVFVFGIINILAIIIDISGLFN